MNHNHNGTQNCPSREKLLQMLNEYSFAISDILLYLPTVKKEWNFIGQISRSAKNYWASMQKIMVLSPLTQQTTAPVSPGNGSCSHGLGKIKEVVNSLCGIMKKDYNIP